MLTGGASLTVAVACAPAGGTYMALQHAAHEHATPADAVLAPDDRSPFEQHDPSAYGDDGERGDEPIVRVHMAFDVERYVVPVDVLAGQRKRVWRLVDELRTDPLTSSHLARNGVRIGVAPPEEGEALREVLTAQQPHVERFTHVVRDGLPLTLELGAVGGDQAVFVTRRDGRLVGKTLSNAVRRLHVDYLVEYGEQPRCTLRVTPELFKQSESPRWVTTEGNVQYRKRYDGVVFHELSVDIEVGPGELLVIGGYDPAAAPFDVGSVMLCDTAADGVPLETMLILTPRLFRQAEDGQAP